MRFLNAIDCILTDLLRDSGLFDKENLVYIENISKHRQYVADFESPVIPTVICAFIFILMSDVPGRDKT